MERGLVERESYDIGSVKYEIVGKDGGKSWILYFIPWIY